MFTINDYSVLEAIIDEKNKLQGIAPKYGTTKAQIIDKTQLSYTTIHNALQKLESLGYVTDGLKKSQAKTYILTLKGADLLRKFKGIRNKEREVNE